ncbi:HVA22-LIKE domain containing PROTEIN,putative [Babesia bigemina]|uniref:HVA22-LIKE domain containing PROTEIN,putative n=1 Tax=Babesia bigemina TaxID=5866 RepID=A0A061DAM0_BABBI|nr:HVA22-LIKE domain containing PROTEIN,putative [Babesia bigemina]CDR95949.1 HVA22-LIKE domain containing PROTEIN,putative [Babesia bigemina]|eukprot:XP_012768135.1 HVA22-LIKE domain containing PROTEIN,putative [Babesia bigemina]
MAISLLSTPTYWVLNLALCVLYPGYKTFTHLYHGLLSGHDDASAEDPRTNCGLFAHHILYWTIFFLFLKLETYFLVYLIPYFPMFYELKLLAFYWLSSYEFKGAGYLFHRFVMRHMLHTSRLIQQELDTKLTPSHRKMISDIGRHLGSVEDVQFANAEQ